MAHLINKYFDKKTPIQYLAVCSGISKENPSVYEMGTLADYFLKPDEEYISLLDYFKEYPEDEPEIMKDYINYCGVIYDYRSIFDAKVFSENDQLSQQLAKRILISFLIRDQNFHYENNGFILKDNKIVSLNPVIDSEFSTMFYKGDKPLINLLKMESYNFSLDKNRVALFKELSEQQYEKYLDGHIALIIEQLKKESDLFHYFCTDAVGQTIDEVAVILDNYVNSYVRTSVQKNNIAFLAERFPEICEDFLFKLEQMIEDLKKSVLVMEDNEFLADFSSDAWAIGYARYKENDEGKAKKLEQDLVTVSINAEQYSNTLLKAVIESSELLKETIGYYLEMEKTHSKQKIKNNREG